MMFYEELFTLKNPRTLPKKSKKSKDFFLRIENPYTLFESEQPLDVQVKQFGEIIFTMSELHFNLFDRRIFHFWRPRRGECYHFLGIRFFFYGIRVMFASSC